jgi:hypothetical protein
MSVEPTDWNFEADGRMGGNAACPFLPTVAGGQLGPWVTRRHGAGKGAEFYVDALRYAQWLWRQRKPAQAILQLNKAWMADLTGAVADDLPAAPYQALVWIMSGAVVDPEAGFLGNPVRHFQHLASRMSGPRAELRSWRAWLCLHLAERTLGPGYPRDGQQLVREGLWVPGSARALHEVAVRGWSGEGRAAELALERAREAGQGQRANQETIPSQARRL